MNSIIETKRLILRPVQSGDVQEMFKLNSSPSVMKYLGGETIKDIELIGNKIKQIQKAYREFGIDRFSVILKETNEYIGWCGIQFVTEEENNHINYYDLGYRLHERYWGKGYGYESALPWINYARDELKIDTLTAGAHVENAGSNRILSKLGMSLINEYVWEGNPWNWYEISFKM